MARGSKRCLPVAEASGWVGDSQCLIFSNEGLEQQVRKAEASSTGMKQTLHKLYINASDASIICMLINSDIHFVITKVYKDKNSIESQ